MEEDVVVVIVVTAMLIIHQQFVNQRHENSNELKGVVAVAIVVAVEIMVAVAIVVAVATMEIVVAVATMATVGVIFVVKEWLSGNKNNNVTKMVTTMRAIKRLHLRVGVNIVQKVINLNTNAMEAAVTTVATVVVRVTVVPATMVGGRNALKCI
jgi:hypothetical protein